MGIANWIQKNYNKEAGGQFNANLKNALAKGIKTGQLKYGDTEQRYRINRDYKDPNKVKKKTPKKKTPKKSTPKKKTSSKKKSSSKKKRVSKKKTSSKKKSTPKKKNSSKKKSKKQN